MNEHDTTVLEARLTMLADDMAPPLDVVRYVRDARARHRRQRRGRITLVALATATAAVVIGTTAASDLLFASSGRGEVAAPTTATPTTARATPTPPSAPPAEEVTGLPSGWEPRSFQGITFAVPPGARTADYVTDEPPAGAEPAPTFIWNGFSLGGGEYAHVKVSILGDEPSFSAPAGYDRVTVQGATEAYVFVEATSYSSPSDPTYRVDGTGMGLEIVASGGRVHVDAVLPAGPEGEQMIRDLIASFDVTGMTPGPAAAAWEPRSFQGVRFAVPPGARAADTVDQRPVSSWYEGPSLTWNGPALGGGEYSYVKVKITSTYEGGMTPADGGEWFTVAGADSAYGAIDAWTGTEGHGPSVASHTLWLQVLAGDRQIFVDGTFPAGEAGEQMARDVIASLAVS